MWTDSRFRNRLTIRSLVCLATWIPWQASLPNIFMILGRQENLKKAGSTENCILDENLLIHVCCLSVCWKNMWVFEFIDLNKNAIFRKKTFTKNVVPNVYVLWLDGTTTLNWSTTMRTTKPPNNVLHPAPMQTTLIQSQLICPTWHWKKTWLVSQSAWLKMLTIFGQNE